MLAQHMFADCNRVIFLYIIVILIMHKLYNIFYYKNSVILFYNNTFRIYLVIFSDADNLKIGKIIDC